MSIEEIAAEAYIFAYPLIVSYGFLYSANLDAQSPAYVGLNNLHHYRELSKPGSPHLNAIPWGNTDTPYSAALVDLRAEPFVLVVPEMAAHRFQDAQFLDLFTHNFAIRGTRTGGNGAATYLVAGPDWQGSVPAGIDEVLRCETQFAKLVTRIALENTEDFAEIEKLEDRYVLQPLSAWLGQQPPAAAQLDFPKPPTRLFEAKSPEFIPYLNFLLTLCPPHPNEADLLAHFARIGIGPGRPFDANALDSKTKAEIQAGIDAAFAKIEARTNWLADPVNGWKYPLDLRGDRALMASGGEALFNRAVAAKYAIWGPSAEEVVYMVVDQDAEGRPLDGTAASYTMRFDQAPPAHGFWSFTVYDAKTRLLVEHPSGRHALRDRYPKPKFDPDGSLNVEISHAAPHDEDANWLPAPERPFQIVARLFWPDASVLNGSFKPPAIYRK